MSYQQKIKHNYYIINIKQNYNIIHYVNILYVKRMRYFFICKYFLFFQTMIKKNIPVACERSSVFPSSWDSFSFKEFFLSAFKMKLTLNVLKEAKSTIET